MSARVRLGNTEADNSEHLKHISSPPDSKPPSGPLSPAKSRLFESMSSSSILPSSGSIKGLGSKLKSAQNQLKTLFGAHSPAPNDIENPPPNNDTESSDAPSLRSSLSGKQTQKHFSLRRMLQASKKVDRDPPAVKAPKKKKPQRSRYIDEGELEQAEEDALAEERGEESKTLSQRKRIAEAWPEKQADKGTGPSPARTHVERFGNHQNAKALVERGKAKLELGDGAAAVELLDDALSRLSELHGSESVETLLATACLSVAQEMVGNHNDSRALKKKVLTICLRCYGRKDKETLSARANLATSYSDLGRHDKALKLQRAVLEVREEELGMEHPQTLLSLHNVGRELCLVGDYEGGLKLLEECLEKRRVAARVREVDVVVTTHWLGKALFALKRFSEAETLFEECSKSCHKQYGAEHPSTISVKNHLERCRRILQEADESSSTHAVAEKARKSMWKDNSAVSMSSSSLSEFFHASALSKWRKEELGTVEAGTSKRSQPQPAGAMEVRALVDEHEEELAELKARQKTEKADAVAVGERDDEARELRNAESALAKLGEEKAVREAEGAAKAKDKALAPEERAAAKKKHQEEMQRTQEEVVQPMRERVAELRASVQAKKELRRKEIERRHRKETADVKKRQQEEMEAMQERMSAAKETTRGRSVAEERQEQGAHPLALGDKAGRADVDASHVEKDVSMHMSGMKYEEAKGESKRVAEDARLRQKLRLAAPARSGKADKLKLRGQKTLLDGSRVCAAEPVLESEV